MGAGIRLQCGMTLLMDTLDRSRNNVRISLLVVYSFAIFLQLTVSKGGMDSMYQELEPEINSMRN